MLWSEYFLAFVMLISSAIYIFDFIVDLIGKKTLDAIASFAYGATTLVMSILILVTKSTGFIPYYVIAFAIALAFMAYVDYKNDRRRAAIVNTILSFIFIMVFILTHIYLILV